MTDSPTPDAAKVTPLTDDEKATVGVAWVIGVEQGLAAVESIVAAREAKAAAKALRDAADHANAQWVLSSVLTDPQTKFAAVSVGRLLELATELDPPDR